MSGVYTKKILLIEDDEILANVLTQKLSLEGFSSFHSKNGEAGIALAKEIFPDMILLDIMMPGMDGFQVLEKLRAEADPKISGIPVIVVSNSGQPVEIDRALKFGIKDYFVKASFDPAEVVAKIRKHLFVANEVTPDTATLTKTKLLIIEDDKFLRDLEAQKLSKEHLEVSTAVDGEQGLKLAEEIIPDVILLDILLPGIDGFEVLTRMKQNHALDKAKVIMLSNFGQREDIEKAQKLGAVKFLIKANYTLDEIVAEVEEVISGKAA